MLLNRVDFYYLCVMSKINLVGQKTLLKELDTKISSGRIAHSYLLFGATGVGKLSVAIKFAERIICSKLNKNELEIISAQQKINGLTLLSSTNKLYLLSKLI